MKQLLCLLSLLLILTGCKSDSVNNVQGYIEGRYTYVSSPVAGNLKQIYIEKGAKVKAGQKLFDLDPMPEAASYQAALSEYKEAVSAKDIIARNIEYLKTTLRRHQTLFNKNAIQQSILDQTQKNYDNALLQFKEAQAKIDILDAKLMTAKWYLSQKTIFAPLNATVFDVYYQVGEYLAKALPVISLITAKDIKLIFYVSEPELALFRLGTSVTISLDGTAKRYKALVNFISPQAEYVPPVLFSKETNAKLVYRLEAKFSDQEAMQLHPGQPVRVIFAS